MEPRQKAHVLHKSSTLAVICSLLHLTLPAPVLGTAHWSHRLQGFASGDCTRDAQAIGVFLKDGHLMGCSQSFAKNMGLYGQRIGCFSIITETPEEAKAVESQMKVWRCSPNTRSLCTSVWHVPGCRNWSRLSSRCEPSLPEGANV